jgi:hypothetical protein
VGNGWITRTKTATKLICTLRVVKLRKAVVERALPALVNVMAQK